MGIRHRSTPPWILPVIIVSQFAGTALWFTGNAVIDDLQQHLGLAGSAVAPVTMAVQAGFILGTLAFAVLAVADRFAPRKVFFASSCAGAAANALIWLAADGLADLLVLRFVTGICLAGIYPVGMKIAAGWYEKGLGQAMGWLIGALVLGTAFPYLVKACGGSLPWATVILTSSATAVAGGLLVLWLVPEGPYHRSAGSLRFGAIRAVFQSPELRSAALGYFGHMWELYAFWTFVPLFLASHPAMVAVSPEYIALWSFVVIAAGCLGCIAGGAVSLRTGSARVACLQLAVSGLCCLVSPLAWGLPPVLFLSLLVLWGITVVGDSPQFSTLVARAAPPQQVGSALTLVNCIGFAVTLGSIQLLMAWSRAADLRWLFVPLLVGPAAGLLAMRPLKNR